MQIDTTNDQRVVENSSLIDKEREILAIISSLNGLSDSEVENVFYLLWVFGNDEGLFTKIVAALNKSPIDYRL